MGVITAFCVRTYAVPEGLCIETHANPALKRWAKICCPLRGRLRGVSKSNTRLKNSSSEEENVSDPVSLGGWRTRRPAIQLSEQPDASNCFRALSNPAHMNKKEIKSPWLTANFVFWFCGVGCLLLLLFLGHYIWRVF
jgi:hypothetical protein